MAAMQNDTFEEIETEEQSQARKLVKALLKEIDFIPSEVKKLIHEDMFIDDEEDYETGAHGDTSAEMLTYQLDHLEEDLADTLIAFFEQFNGDIKDSIDKFVKDPTSRRDLPKWQKAEPILVDHSLQDKPPKERGIPLIVVKQSS